MLDQFRENYSSQVELCILSSGRKVGLSKLGPEYVILREGTSFLSGRAQVVMSVDGDLRTWDVWVTSDAVPFERRVDVIPINE